MNHASQNDHANPKEELIEAQVRHITFRSAESDFAICSMDRLDRKEAITAIGPLKSFHTGDRLNLVGRFETHGKYGLQFRVQMAYPIPPNDQEAIREYLVNAKIRGVGAKRVDTLIELFGDDTLKVIIEEPERLHEISGFGSGHIERLQEAVKNQQGRQKVMLFLYELKLSAVIAARVWAQYQEHSKEIIEENPYRLINDIDSFYFEHADAIAKRLGWSADSLERAQAALHEHLIRCYDDGHVCLPSEELRRRALMTIGSQERVEQAINTQMKTKQLIEVTQFHTPCLFQAEMAHLEAEAAREVAALIDKTHQKLSYEMSDLEAISGIKLAEAQAEAIKVASTEGLLLLTGGPGTGKTTTVKTLIALFESHHLDVKLAAPTGRAAKRLSETTERDAQTIHRLLDYQPLEEEFRRGVDLALEADIVLVDEMSMVDLKLFVALLRALPTQCRLILVGDANQLPSVGAGRVYHDLLSAQCLPTVELTHIFRQAQESSIVTNAYQILKGLPLITPPLEPLPDFFEVKAQNAQQAAELIKALVTERIPDRFKIESREIQVITPMYRGHCGADQLNLKLQELLNPNGRALKTKSQLRVGDRVMQLKNFYDKDVYNGDTGVIITRHEEGVVVDFGGRVVNYTKENLHMLTLAYACSIHKSQGSEYAAVVIPVLDEHWTMLQRDLLYTAVTRAQRLAVLVTMPSALQRAITHQSSHLRYTLLKDRLCELTASP